ncbi:MAG: periplasmic heavy metal sensor [Bacteroidota bacterium]
MKNSKVSVGALSLLIMLSVISFGQNRGESRNRMEQRSEMRQNFLDRIPDITNDQKENIKALRTENQKQILPLRNQLGEKEARLKTLTTADEADMKSINAMIEEIGSLKIEMAKLKAATHQKVRAELTDDQRLFLDTHTGRERKMLRQRGLRQGK